MLRPIQDIFPDTKQLLCTWHINRDVEVRVSALLGKNKKRGEYFRSAHWSRLMYAPTEAIYVRELRILRDKWRSYPKVFEYVGTTWLVHKEKFNSAWTDGILSLNNTTTCRVESAHASLKSWLKTSTNSIENFFTRANAMVEQQVDKIKFGLESSRRKQCVRYRSAPFARLWGHVSQHCLKLLDVEESRMRNMGNSVRELCGHVLHSKCGLPCACDIHDAFECGTCIYRNQVHPFWSTLVIGDEISNSDWIDEEAEEAEHLRDLCEEARRRGTAQMRHASRILREMLYLDSADVEEPAVNTTMRGRPSTQNSSTRRRPSYFEYTATRGCGWGRGRGQDSRATVSNHLPGDDEFDINEMPSKNLVPSIILPCFIRWKDVVGDGNCGFRVIVDAFQGGEDNWGCVRTFIANEIVRHPIYSQIYGGLTLVQEAIDRITWTGGRCGEEHWMEVAADLFAIANLYTCGIFFFGYGNDRSLYPCCTVLPWSDPPTARAPRSELSIVHVGRHYYRLFIAQECPIPPIANYWYTVCSPSVRGWDDLYAARVEDWHGHVDLLG